MSFWKKLFGGAGAPAEPATGAAVKTIDHKGFSIRATPYKEGGQFQTCGVIAKEVGGALREYRFIRADRFATVEEAADISLAKGRQIVDEQGEEIFR